MVLDDRESADDELYCVSDHIPTLPNNLALDSVSLPRADAKTHWEADEETSLQLLHVLRYVIKSNIFLSHLLEFNACILSPLLTGPRNPNDPGQVFDEALRGGARICG